MRAVTPVTERVLETPSTVTLRFDYSAAADPGQFVMVWFPGDDELPMSLSYTQGRSKGVTIKAMGNTSRAVQALRAGERIGVRGPYGNRFDLAARRILVVGGGSGSAVLAPAAELAAAAGAQVTAALGATQSAELLFRRRFEGMGARVEVATDDGSEGTKGFVTGVADRLLGSEGFDVVWTCGPEVMMQKVAVSARERGVPVYCSVERHMKCALGMCDACALGPYHVCVDGPVFPAEQLLPLEEFSRAHRDPSGRRVPFGGR
ncbi:MAG: dihydroorotate dehydrogenase electron transfer subunit [Thermoplasmata archaeon]